MNAIVEKWVPQTIRDLHAYHVPAASDMIKMDAMENPYSLPAALHQQWLELLSTLEFNRYPDPGAQAVKAAIRTVFSVPEESAMILGNGSDELIQMVAALVGGEGRVFLSPEPSFSMYRLISQASRTQYIEYRLNENFEIDSKHLLNLIEAHQPACVFIAYPNNPTGNSFDRGLIDKVISTAPGLVVVDEAYFSFSGQTYLSELPKYENLLVMRTLSKSGLAGLRLGMMMGHSDWISQLEKIRLPYNINVLTQATAVFCLENYTVFAEQASEIVQTRAWLAQQLIDREIKIYPSDTNFILMRLDADASIIFEGLQERKILIKNLHGSDSSLENCLRVTVGTRQQCQQFLNALDTLLV